MGTEKPRQRQTQRQTQEVELQGRTSLYSIPQYLGKRVVLELERIGIRSYVYSGDFVEYDGRFLTFENFKSHKMDIRATIMFKDDEGSSCDILSEKSVIYSLPKTTINANQVASIQTLDDVLSSQHRGETQ